MKNFRIILLVAIIFAISTPVFAEQQKVNDHQKLVIQVTEGNLNPKEINAIKKLMSLHEKYTDGQNAKELKKLYASEYVSGDGFNKEALFEITEKAWKNYPKMKYVSAPSYIKVNGDYASIESFDSLTASSIQNTSLKDDTGILLSNSHTILYLKKFALDWKIVSDKTLSEKTMLQYGTAKNYKFALNAPEQVVAGQDYTTSLKAEVTNPNSVTIASITNEPIVYPTAKSKDVFRQVEDGTLERVIRANTTNNNELTVVSVAITELLPDLTQKLQPKLAGMAVLIQRVNVIPKSNYIPVKLDQSKDDINSAKAELNEQH